MEFWYWYIIALWRINLLIEGENNNQIKSINNFFKNLEIIRSIFSRDGTSWTKWNYNFQIKLLKKTIYIYWASDAKSPKRHLHLHPIQMGVLDNSRILLSISQLRVSTWKVISPWQRRSLPPYSLLINQSHSFKISLESSHSNFKRGGCKGVRVLFIMEEEEKNKAIYNRLPPSKIKQWRKKYILL